MAELSHRGCFRRTRSKQGSLKQAMERKAARYTKGVASKEGMQKHQLEMVEYAHR